MSRHHPLSALRALSLVGLFALVLASAGLVSVDQASALCAMPRLSATLVTPLNAPVPPGASLLLRLDYAYGRGSVPVTRAGRDDIRLPNAALVRGAERIPLQTTMLPGGLVRLDFERPPADGVYMLEGLSVDGVPPPSITIGGALPAAPSAPRVRRVTHSEEQETHDGPRGRVRTQRWATTVTLAQPLARTQVRLVLQSTDGSGSGQVLDVRLGRAAVRAQGTAGGRCGAPSLPGERRVAAGSRVQVLAVDIYGRVSAPSAVVRVERAER